MELTAWAGGWFFWTTLPLCFFVAWSDLARMKIPTLATDALLLVYVVVGLIALPFTAYLWGYAHFAVMLAVGIALNAARAIGAGDAKFVASAAPFVALSDFFIIVVLLCASILGAVATHRIAGLTPIRRMVPHWESWTTGVRFPMGFPLAMTLSFYLGLVWLLR